MSELQVGIEVYRNHDQQFERLLEKDVCERKIAVKLHLSEYEQGFQLKGIDEDNTEAMVQIETQKVLADRVDLAREQTLKQLSKWGNTAFSSSDITIETTSTYFIAASVLNQLRRDLAEQLKDKRIKEYQPEQIVFPEIPHLPLPPGKNRSIRRCRKPPWISLP